MKYVAFKDRFDALGAAHRLALLDEPGKGLYHSKATRHDGDTTIGIPDSIASKLSATAQARAGSTIAAAKGRRQ